MGHKFKSTKRYLVVDRHYNDLLLSRFINYIMRDGKKTRARKIVYDALDLISQRVKEKDPLDVFLIAVNNVKPLIEVRSRRVGGANYQVPMEISRDRQLTLALRWIVSSARDKKGRPMFERVADELSDAYKKQGTSMKKRENVHRMAEANKAFAHFAW